MKLSKAEKDDLQEFIAERCSRPDWKNASLLDEHYTPVFGKIVLALAVSWLVILAVGILYSNLFWGSMLLLTLGLSWLLATKIFQRLSDMVQTLGMTLRTLDKPTQRKPLVTGK